MFGSHEHRRRRHPHLRRFLLRAMITGSPLGAGGFGGSGGAGGVGGAGGAGGVGGADNDIHQDNEKDDRINPPIDSDVDEIEEEIEAAGKVESDEYSDSEAICESYKILQSSKNTNSISIDNQKEIVQFGGEESEEYSLPIVMFSLYQKVDQNSNLEDEDAFNDDEEADENEENCSIEDELSKLCKIRVCLCQRTEQGKLLYVSNFVDTEFIEETKAKQDIAVESINPRKYLCKCGNETITITLNTDGEKNGFVVSLNGTTLDMHKIRGVQKKQWSFKSIPPITLEQKTMHVKVAKKSMSETIKQNRNPYNDIAEDTLWADDFIYIDHSENPHKHINHLCSIQ